jgi:cysteine desulfurase
MDYQATTPLDPRVLDAMLPFMSVSFGNPHSSSHAHGRLAMRAVDDSREAVADLIGASPAEIVFTSGATESNNMLLRGAVAAGSRSGRSDVVTCVTEHAAVLDVARWLGNQGGEVSILNVGGDGLLDPGAVALAASERTAVVSVMLANNEIGVIQPAGAIADAAHGVGALFHTDAAQAVGRVPVDVRGLDVDALSFTAHKMYGPMGIGAAFVAKRARRRVDALIMGGGQQGGLRSGTLPVALCVGFGEAARICAAEMEGEARRVAGLRDDLLAALAAAGAAFELNGAVEPRLPGNINVSFPGVDAEALLMKVGAVLSISSGSACTAESIEPSHVVSALGGRGHRAEEAIRISLGRMTTAAEVVEAARIVAKAVARLRSVGYTPVKG